MSSWQILIVAKNPPVNKGDSEQALSFLQQYGGRL